MASRCDEPTTRLAKGLSRAGVCIAAASGPALETQLSSWLAFICKGIISAMQARKHLDTSGCFQAPATSTPREFFPKGRGRTKPKASTQRRCRTLEDGGGSAKPSCTIWGPVKHMPPNFVCMLYKRTALPPPHSLGAPGVPRKLQMNPCQYLITLSLILTHPVADGLNKELSMLNH